MTDDYTKTIIGWIPDPANDDSFVAPSLIPAYPNSDCVLYLPFTGDDGGTVIDDFSASNHSITPTGGAALDTAQYKFAPTSLLLPAAATLTIGNSADFNFGTGDFAIETFFKVSAAPDNSIYFYKHDSGADKMWFYWDSADSKIILYAVNGVDTLVIIPGAAQALPINAWHHIIAMRYDADWFLVFNGDIIASPNQSFTMPNLAVNLTMQNNSIVNVWLDEYRILKGAPDFDYATPPTASYGSATVQTTDICRYRIAHGRASQRGPITTATIDAAGVMSGFPGNNITNFTSKNSIDGKIILTWVYDSTGELARPTGFKVYLWTGGAWVLQATIPYSRQGATWTSGVNAHGTVLLYKVVTYRSVNGTDYESAGQQATITADAEGPAAITSITVS